MIFFFKKVHFSQKSRRYTKENSPDTTPSTLPSHYIYIKDALTEAENAAMRQATHNKFEREQPHLTHTSAQQPHNSTHQQTTTENTQTTHIEQTHKRAITHARTAVIQTPYLRTAQSRTRNQPQAGNSIGCLVFFIYKQTNNSNNDKK